ncbi:hypothetical protein PJE062_3700 [Pseudovibrio sp. JE062]|nr:hypothetical protein PJE062_3700 [Pseudovibrio sp. JE062]
MEMKPVRTRAYLACVWTAHCDHLKELGLIMQGLFCRIMAS